MLLVQAFKQLNTQYNRRTNASGCPLAVHRVKVTFRDEPGEGSGVARSFYTAFCQAVLSSENLPSLEGVLIGSKTLQYSEFLECFHYVYTPGNCAKFRQIFCHPTFHIL